MPNTYSCSVHVHVSFQVYTSFQIKSYNYVCKLVFGWTMQQYYSSTVDSKKENNSLSLQPNLEKNVTLKRTARPVSKVVVSFYHYVKCAVFFHRHGSSHSTAQLGGTVWWYGTPLRCVYIPISWLVQHVKWLERKMTRHASAFSTFVAPA